MALKTLEIRVADEAVGRADKLVQAMTGHSRSQIRGLFDHQCVSINGQPCSDPGLALAVGDQVVVTFDPHTRYHEKKAHWSDRTFSLVYEDDEIVIVDKSSGVLTVPTEQGEPNTLMERVSVFLSHGRKRRPALVVHRLDREVSGLLVMAKTEQARARLAEQFKEHKPERKYHAIIRGTLKTPEGTIRNFLKTAKNLDRFATDDEVDGELAITHYKVITALQEATLVEVRLETGRRNQIRVHMANLGHPLLGDDRYGRHSRPHPKWTSKRIALHAATLSFIHPRTAKTMQFDSPLPPVMDRFVRATAIA